MEDITGAPVEGYKHKLFKMPFAFVFEMKNSKEKSLRKAINAYNSAKEGHCLIAFANFTGKNLYNFHGGGLHFIQAEKWPKLGPRAQLKVLKTQNSKVIIVPHVAICGM